MEENFSPQQSLQLIQSMIDKTKTNISESRFYFLFWGWLAFGACILQYFLLVVIKTPYHYYAWTLVWVGVFVTIYYSVAKRKTKKVSTYVGDSMKYLWTGIGITFPVVGWICAINEWHNCFSLFIILYAVGTFVSGCLLKFRPYIIGGILCWIIAPFAAYVAYEWQILLTALALLVSYIIPSYLLSMQYKKQTMPDYQKRI